MKRTRRAGAEGSTPWLAASAEEEEHAKSDEEAVRACNTSLAALSLSVAVVIEPCLVPGETEGVCGAWGWAVGREEGALESSASASLSTAAGVEVASIAGFASLLLLLQLPASADAAASADAVFAISIAAQF